MPFKRKASSLSLAYMSCCKLCTSQNPFEEHYLEQWYKHEIARKWFTYHVLWSRYTHGALIWVPCGFLIYSLLEGFWAIGIVLAIPQGHGGLCTLNWQKRAINSVFDRTTRRYIRPASGPFPDLALKKVSSTTSSSELSRTPYGIRVSSFGPTWSDLFRISLLRSKNILSRVI